MPIYEYLCGDCRGKFELLSLGRDEMPVACTACHSTNVRKLFSVFASHTRAGDGAELSGEIGCGDEACAGGMCGCGDFAMDD